MFTLQAAGDALEAAAPAACRVDMWPASLCEDVKGSMACRHGMMDRPVTDKDHRPFSNSSCSELVHELPHSAPQRQALALQQCG